MQVIEARLERMANDAEEAKSSAGVAQLSAQQFRGIETGARLAGISSFTPTRMGADPAGETMAFAVNIVFASAGKVESITTVAPSTQRPHVPVIDVDSEISNDAIDITPDSYAAADKTAMSTGSSADDSSQTPPEE
jgi:hypothetical protein